MIDWIIEETDTVTKRFCDYFGNRISGVNAGYSVALTGGNSAKPFYSALARRLREEQSWNRSALEFYWSDERLVPADHPDSNFKLAGDLLLRPAGFRDDQLHRPASELPGAECAARYAGEIRQNIKANTHWLPQFSLILLGLGEDGHTASLFPDTDIYYCDEELVRFAAGDAKHVDDRVTFTPTLLNSALEVWFIITGEQKREATRRLYERKTSEFETPALVVNPERVRVTVFCDRAAAGDLKAFAA
jgi:6-phosphogluconolactonase